jgi:hypothetical protein
MIQLDITSIKKIDRWSYHIDHVEQELNKIVKRIYPARDIHFPKVLLSLPAFGLTEPVLEDDYKTISIEKLLPFLQWFNTTLMCIQKEDINPLWKSSCLYGYITEFEADHLVSDRIWIMYFDTQSSNCLVLRNNSTRHVIQCHQAYYLLHEETRYPTLYDAFVHLGIPKQDVFYHDNYELPIYSNIMVWHMASTKRTPLDIIHFLLDTFLDKKECRIEPRYLELHDSYQESIPFTYTSGRATIGLFITDLKSETKVLSHTLQPGSPCVLPYFSLYHENDVYIIYEPMLPPFIKLHTLLKHYDTFYSDWERIKWLIFTQLINAVHTMHSKSIYHRYINMFTTYIHPYTMEIRFGHTVHYCHHELSCEILPVLQNYELLDYELDSHQGNRLQLLRNGIDVAMALDWYSAGWLSMYILFGTFSRLFFDINHMAEKTFDHMYLSMKKDKIKSDLFAMTFTIVKDYYISKATPCDILVAKLYDYCWTLLIRHCFSDHFDIKNRRIPDSSLQVWNTIMSSVDVDMCRIKNNREIDQQIALASIPELSCPHPSQKIDVSREMTLLITGHGVDQDRFDFLQSLNHVFIASPVRHGCLNMTDTKYELESISALYKTQSHLPSCMVMNYFLNYNKNQVEYDYLKQLSKHATSLDTLVEQSQTIKRMMSRNAHSKIIQPIVDRKYVFTGDGPKDRYNGVFIVQLKHPDYPFPNSTTEFPPNLIDTNDSKANATIPFFKGMSAQPLQTILLSDILKPIHTEFDQINIIDLTCRSSGLKRLNSVDITREEDRPRQGRSQRKKGKKSHPKKRLTGF